MNQPALIDFLADLKTQISPHNGRLVQTQEEVSLKGISVSKMDKSAYGLTLSIKLLNPPRLSITHKNKVLVETDNWRDITDPTRDPRFKHLITSYLHKAFDKVSDKDKYMGLSSIEGEGTMKRAESIRRVVKAYLGD